MRVLNLFKFPFAVKPNENESIRKFVMKFFRLNLIYDVETYSKLIIYKTIINESVPISYKQPVFLLALSVNIYCCFLSCALFKF